MKVLDLNLLLYAVNRDSPRHADAKAWLEETLSGDERIGLPWAVILGFIRLATNARVVTNPVTTEQAVAVVDSWLGLASVAPLDPGEDHWRILRELLLDTGPPETSPPTRTSLPSRSSTAESCVPPTPTSRAFRD